MTTALELTSLERQASEAVDAGWTIDALQSLVRLPSVTGDEGAVRPGAHWREFRRSELMRDQSPTAALQNTRSGAMTLPSRRSAARKAR